MTLTIARVYNNKKDRHRASTSMILANISRSRYVAITTQPCTDWKSAEYCTSRGL